MKHDLQGIIYTLRSSDELRDLVTSRNAASIPFCGRYRLIDFALSSMSNAGIRDVGVIMERDYQSLLDHLNGGKAWGLSRRSGGLRLLPPFGLPEAHAGSYSGCMEALRSVRSYIEDIQRENIVLTAADYVANIDITAVAEQHIQSGADITAVCVDDEPGYAKYRFIPDDDGFARKLIVTDRKTPEGFATSEVYIIKKDLLLQFMNYCTTEDRVHFHRDALKHYLAQGGKVGIYHHKGYFHRIESVKSYYETSLELLQPEIMSGLFPEERPIYTKGRSSVSTYYGENAVVRNSMLADGCIVEGEVVNCVLFRGVRVGKGAKLKNCVIMQDTVIGENVSLTSIIADKDCRFTDGCTLSGSDRLPVPVPKGAVV